MKDVLVVGAGIFGITAARELRRRGATVTVVDPGPVPHERAATTDISKVVRLDYGSDALYTELGAEALAGWERWNEELGPLYHPDGFLLLAGGAMQPGGFEHDSFTLLEKRGEPVERIDPQQLAARFPAWNPARYPDGYVNRRGGWAESGKVLAALAVRVKEEGVTLREGFAVRSLLTEGTTVRGVSSVSGEELRAGLTLVALGAWTPTLLPHLADRLWAVGQPVLHFRAPDPKALQPPHFLPWAADISRTGWYGFPSLADGTVKVANHGPGLRVHPDAPREVPPGTEARFRAFFRESLPILADAPLLKARLCLYCDSFDGNFFVDHDPDREGLLVATGDSGHAFKFAPALGSVIAAAVERRTTPYTARFSWRSRGAVATEEARFDG